MSENHAHALFVSQRAQVREAVKAAMPKLREAMESNGIGLGSTSVSDGVFTPDRSAATRIRAGHWRHAHGTQQRRRRFEHGERVSCGANASDDRAHRHIR